VRKLKTEERTLTERFGQALLLRHFMLHTLSLALS
jgi:hypothetical protein